MTKEEILVKNNWGEFPNKKTTLAAMDEYAKQEAIGFKNWIIKLPPNKLCSVWPPAGSGSGTGLYLKEDSVLWDEYQKEKL